MDIRPRGKDYTLREIIDLLSDVFSIKVVSEKIVQFTKDDDIGRKSGYHGSGTKYTYVYELETEFDAYECRSIIEYRFGGFAFNKRGGNMGTYYHIIHEYVDLDTQISYPQMCALELLPDEILMKIVKYIEDDSVWSYKSVEWPTCYISRYDQIHYFVEATNRTILFDKYKTDKKRSFYNHNIFDLKVIRQILQDCNNVTDIELRTYGTKDVEQVIKRKKMDVANHMLFMIGVINYKGWCSGFRNFAREILLSLDQESGKLIRDDLHIHLIDLGEFKVLRHLAPSYYHKTLKHLCSCVLIKGTSISDNLDFIEKNLGSSITSFSNKPLREYFFQDYLFEHGPKMFEDLWVEKWDPSGTKFLECFSSAIKHEREDDLVAFGCKPIKHKLIDATAAFATNNYKKLTRLNNIYLGLAVEYKNLIVQKLREEISKSHMSNVFEGEGYLEAAQNMRILKLEVIRADKFVYASYVSQIAPEDEELMKILSAVNVINIKDDYGRFHPELIDEKGPLDGKQHSFRSFHQMEEKTNTFSIYEWFRLWDIFVYGSVSSDTSLIKFIEQSKRRGIHLPKSNYELVRDDDMYVSSSKIEILKKYGLYEEPEQPSSDSDDYW